MSIRLQAFNLVDNCPRSSNSDLPTFRLAFSWLIGVRLAQVSSALGQGKGMLFRWRVFEKVFGQDYLSFIRATQSLLASVGGWPMAA